MHDGYKKCMNIFGYSFALYITIYCTVSPISWYVFSVQIFGNPHSNTFLIYFKTMQNWAYYKKCDNCWCSKLLLSNTHIQASRETGIDREREEWDKPNPFYQAGTIILARKKKSLPPSPTCHHVPHKPPHPFFINLHTLFCIFLHTQCWHTHTCMGGEGVSSCMRPQLLSGRLQGNKSVWRTSWEDFC